ncbi:MAG TPA: YHS domain-containing protein [Ignavibacteria bacterium]|nr:YHS domain-containing protein [Ignavibacteria bacterium]
MKLKILMKNLSLLFLLFAMLLTFNSSLSAKIGPENRELSDSATCLVSGEVIKEGKGAKLMYLGKEYLFCCEGCVGEFKAASIKYTNGVATCPICNEDDAKESITTSHDGTTYYFCNNKCKEKFNKDPEKILNKYN